ncbi:hypothetical protein B0H11DRAFT_2257750 [Mycena galericulata]|nr:hypothetical protein B0H11DRAFT_2257750 [Mycena galericulata]
MQTRALLPFLATWRWLRNGSGPDAPVVARPASPDTSTSSQSVVKKRKLALLSSDEEDTPPKKNRAAGGSRPKPRISKAKDDELALSDEDDPPPPKKFPRKSAAPVFLPSDDDNHDEEFVVNSGDEELAPKKPAAKAKAGPSKANGEAAANGKGEEKEQEKEEAPKEKFKAAKLADPAAPGSKAVPDGAPKCLAGLSFVLTSELSSFSSRRGRRYREALRRQCCRAALFEDELLRARRRRRALEAQRDQEHGIADRSRASAVRACIRIHAWTPDVHGDPVALRARRPRACPVRTTCTYCPYACRDHLHLYIHVSIHALAPSLAVRAPPILYVGGSTPPPLVFPAPLVGCVVALSVPTFGLPRTVGTHHAHLYKVAERAHQAQRAETLAHDEEQTVSSAA